MGGKNRAPLGLRLSLHPACLCEEEGVKSGFINWALIVYFSC